jgi:hypothetical protein
MSCEECRRVERSGLRNRALRREISVVRHSADNTFLALCVNDSPATEALGKLWASGEFDCGPEDYEFIVERCLEAVREYNEYRTSPMAAALCQVDT